MACLLDHLWGKVLGSTAIGSSSLGLICLDEVGPSEISQFDSAISINEDVLRLDVSVDDRRILCVAVLDGTDYFTKVLGGDRLLKSAFAL